MKGRSLLPRGYVSELSLEGVSTTLGTGGRDTKESLWRMWVVWRNGANRGSEHGMASLGLVLQAPKTGHNRLFGPDLLGNSILFTPESNPCGRGVGPSCPEVKPALISQLTSVA